MQYSRVKVDHLELHDSLCFIDLMITVLHMAGF